MSGEAPNLVLEQLRLIREVMALSRRDESDMRSVVLSVTERLRRLERRLDEVRDDLELTIKAEIMGRLGHLRTETEKQIGALRDQIGSAHQLAGSPAP